MIYHWNPNELDGVPLESSSNWWCGTGILVKFVVYRSNPNKIMMFHSNPLKIYGIPLISLSNLLCTTGFLNGIFIKCMVFHWNYRWNRAGLFARFATSFTFSVFEILSFSLRALYWRWGACSCVHIRCLVSLSSFFWKGTNEAIHFSWMFFFE